MVYKKGERKTPQQKRKKMKKIILTQENDSGRKELLIYTDENEFLASEDPTISYKVLELRNSFCEQKLLLQGAAIVELQETKEIIAFGYDMDALQLIADLGQAVKIEIVELQPTALFQKRYR